MLLTPFLLLAVLAEASAPSASALKEYTLSAAGIKASFIPFGARLKSLQVPDRAGTWREVNLGYEDAEDYGREKAPSYFGAVIGRYANRIRGGKFEIDGKEYSVPTNENGGRNTLHGGYTGYDAREWTVVTHNESTITFSLMDYGFEGFPGNVLAFASHTLSGSTLKTVLTAQALDAPTPILLTTHSFFNLGSDLSSTVMDDELHLPGASRFVDVDDISLPTGKLINTAVQASTRHALNFSTPHVMRDAPEGVDNCFIFDHPSTGNEVGPAQVIWTSPVTGIQMRIHTNQPAIQLYSCLGLDGSVTTTIGKAEKYGCMAVEPQGWIDGVNHPEWLQDQIYRPGGAPFVNVAEYVFDVVGKGKPVGKVVHEEL